MKRAAANPPASDARGITCPKCGCRHFEVVYVYPVKGGRICRRRQCRHCGRRITTYEQALCS